MCQIRRHVLDELYPRSVLHTLPKVSVGSAIRVATIPDIGMARAFHISCLPKSARRIDLGKSGHFFLCAEHEMRPNTKLRVAIVVLPEWALKLGQACLRLKRKEFTLPPWILTEADRLAAADLERRHLERKCKTLAPSTGEPSGNSHT